MMATKIEQEDVMVNYEDKYGVIEHLPKSEAIARGYKDKLPKSVLATYESVKYPC